MPAYERKAFHVVTSFRFLLCTPKYHSCLSIVIKDKAGQTCFIEVWNEEHSMWSLSGQNRYIIGPGFRRGPWEICDPWVDREDFLQEKAEKNPVNFSCTSKYFVFVVITKQHYFSIQFAKSVDKMTATCQEFLGSFWTSLMRSEMKECETSCQKQGGKWNGMQKSLALPS